jgi:hypothetical protein
MRGQSDLARDGKTKDWEKKEEETSNLIARIFYSVSLINN